MHITGMSVQGHPVTQETSSGGKPVLSGSLFETRKIVLSYLDNSFTFAFSTMDFREAGNIVYEYRLSGSGEDWNRTASRCEQDTFQPFASRPLHVAGESLREWCAFAGERHRHPYRPALVLVGVG